MNWDEFTVEQAVVHYVPTEKVNAQPDGQSGLLLTDDAIELDPGLQAYFRDKIANRLSSKGMEVLADPDQVQIVPDAVRAVLADHSDLVAQSKEIATHLHAIQSKVNSSGLLAVVLGQVSAAPSVAVIKLEPERGVRYAISTVDGRHTVDLELLRNLTLTDKTKVYKTALLLDEGGTIAGWAADDQRTIASGVQVATFFLSRFLGCAPKMPAAITTYEFVRAASASFNEDIESPKQRSRYQVALLAVMQDNTNTITPRTFAETHLDAGDRPVFLDRVENAGIPPTTTFAKDTSRVNVSKFTMTFTSGNLTLVGDRDALDTTVEIPDDNQPNEPVRLHTTVDDIITGK
jgi:37-kD nucleoid-associated bacterial protein